MTNLVPDNQMLDADAWFSTGGVGVLRSANSTWSRSRGYLSIPATGAVVQAYSLTPIPVTAGEEYWCEFQSNASAGSVIDIRCYVQFLDADGMVMSGSPLIGRHEVDGARTSGIAVVVPTGAIGMRLRYWRSATTDTLVRFRGPAIFRRNAGQLIVDGAITANKLDAGAVTTDKLAAGSVVANKIAAGAIAATHLASEALITKTAQIGDAVVDTLTIKDRAVTLPAYEVTANSPTVVATSSWQEIASITFDRQAGYPTFVELDIGVAGTGLASAEFEFRRNGSAIGSGLLSSGANGFTIKQSAYIRDSNVSGGVTTYSVHVRNNTGVSGYDGARFGRALMRATQFFR